MKKEEFLRKVFSINTEAGFKIRYMDTKAFCCRNYEKEITYTWAYMRTDKAYKGIKRLFDWIATPEGVEYWAGLSEALYMNNLWEETKERKNV